MQNSLYNLLGLLVHSDFHTLTGALELLPKIVTL